MSADRGDMRRPDDGHRALIAAARAQVEQMTRGSSAFARDTITVEGLLRRPDLQRYKLVSELHRGGQGVVYLAEQRSPHRQVAIKMVRQGPLASRDEQARFRREIETLGSLSHPYIVSIHDSGSDAGFLYYVMDFVDGPALDEFVRPMRERALASRSRREVRKFLRATLELFAKVCDAVQAAHLRGVIHRDLKPSNIRIDPRGEPRVLDFGLAKATTAEGLADSAHTLTEAGQFLGTLAFASPEQIEGSAADLDVRTDVYSLGMILYELLTGQPPYPVSGNLSDILDAIRRQEPTRPSTIVPELCGDLEVILLTSLQKKRERRYETPGRLAADIRRYLVGEPIAAKRDSGLYHLRMFVRRHRVAALSTIAFIVLLIASSVALGLMYTRQVELRTLAQQSEQRARDSEALAIQREKEAIRVTEFQASQLSGIDTERMGLRLRQDLLDSVRKATKSANADDPAAAQQLEDFEQRLARVNFTNLALHALEENIFDRTILTIEQQFADQPLVQARLQQTLADTMSQLGLFEPAVAPQTDALEIRRSILGEEHTDTLTSMNAMGRLLQSMARWEEAMAHYTNVLDARRRILGDQHPDTLGSINNLGSLLVELGQLDKALIYYEEALDIGRRVLGDEHPDILTWTNNLAFLLEKMGRRDEALDNYTYVLHARRRVLGNSHPATLNVLANLGRLTRTMGRLDESLTYLQEALDGNRRVLGNEHLRTIQALNSMGAVLQSSGRYDEAEAHFREALTTSRRILGNEHTETLAVINNLGHLFHSMGRFEEALPYYQDALENFRRLLGEDHPNTLTLMNNVGSLLASLGRFEEAMAYRKDALAGRRRVLGDEHPDTLNSILGMGYLLLKSERLEEAMAYYEEAQEGCRRVLGEEHPLTFNATGSIGGVLQAMGQLDEALIYRREALDGYRRILGDAHPSTLHSINLVGTLLLAMQRFEDAEQLFHEAAAGAENLPPEHVLRSQIAENLAELYDAWHAAEPNQGHDRSADHWRSLLEETQETAASVSQP